MRHQRGAHELVTQVPPAFDHNIERRAQQVMPRCPPGTRGLGLFCHRAGRVDFSFQHVEAVTERGKRRRRLTLRAAIAACSPTGSVACQDTPQSKQPSQPPLRFTRLPRLHVPVPAQLSRTAVVRPPLSRSIARQASDLPSAGITFRKVALRRLLPPAGCAAGDLRCGSSRHRFCKHPRCRTAARQTIRFRQSP